MATPPEYPVASCLTPNRPCYRVVALPCRPRFHRWRRHQFEGRIGNVKWERRGTRQKGQ
ncbi:type VI secretion system baseplate subunit TssF [Sesbania bispinosa]|nr:type VI secretion system baseplate subunit TssF [Sesbania bispinosa]